MRCASEPHHDFCGGPAEVGTFAVSYGGAWVPVLRQKRHQSAVDGDSVHPAICACVWL
jgi:hypothetical protein